MTVFVFSRIQTSTTGNEPDILTDLSRLLEKYLRTRQNTAWSVPNLYESAGSGTGMNRSRFKHKTIVLHFESTRGVTPL